MRHTPTHIRAYKIATLPHCSEMTSEYPVAQRLNNPLADTASHVTGPLPSAIADDETQIFLAPFYNQAHKPNRDRRGTIADPNDMLDQSPQECANTLSQPVYFEGRIFSNREDAFQFGKVKLMQDWFACHQDRFQVIEKDKKRFAQLQKKLNAIANDFAVDPSKLTDPAVREQWKKNKKAVNDFFSGEFKKTRQQYPDIPGKRATPDWQIINFQRMKDIWLAYAEQYPTFKQLMLDLWRHRILPIEDSPNDNIWGLGKKFSIAEPAKLLLSKVFLTCVGQWSTTPFTVDDDAWDVLTSAISNLVLQTGRVDEAYLQTVCQCAFVLPIFYGNYPMQRTFLPTLLFSADPNMSSEKNKTLSFPDTLDINKMSTYGDVNNGHANVDDQSVDDASIVELCQALLRDFKPADKSLDVGLAFVRQQNTFAKFIFNSPLIAANCAERISNILGLAASRIHTENLVDYRYPDGFSVSVAVPSAHIFSQLCLLYNECPRLFPYYGEVLLQLLSDIYDKTSSYQLKYRDFLEQLKSKTKIIQGSLELDEEDDDIDDTGTTPNPLEKFISNNPNAPDYFKAQASQLTVQFPSVILGNVAAKDKALLNSIMSRYACPTLQNTKSVHPFDAQMRSWLLTQAAGVTHDSPARSVAAYNIRKLTLNKNSFSRAFPSFGETHLLSVNTQGALPHYPLQQWDYSGSSPKLITLINTQEIHAQQESVAVQASYPMLSLVNAAGDFGQDEAPAKMQAHFASPYQTNNHAELMSQPNLLPNSVAASMIISSRGFQLADIENGAFLTQPQPHHANNPLSMTPLHQVTVSGINFTDEASCAAFVIPEPSKWAFMSSLFGGGKQPTSSSSSSAPSSAAANDDDDDDVVEIVNVVTKPAKPGLDEAKYKQFSLEKYRMVLQSFTNHGVQDAVMTLESTGYYAGRYRQAICDIKALCLVNALIQHGRHNSLMRTLLIPAGVSMSDGKVDDTLYRALLDKFSGLEQNFDKLYLPKTIIIANCHPRAGVPILRQYFVERNGPQAPIPVIGEMIPGDRIPVPGYNLQDENANSPDQTSTSVTTRLFTQSSEMNALLQDVKRYHLEGAPEVSLVEELR